MKGRTKQFLMELLNTNSYISYAEFSNSFNVSNRTARYEVSAINLFLKNLGLPSLEQKKGLGLKISLTESQREKLDSAMEKQEEDDDYYTPDERFVNLLFSIINTKKRTLLYKFEEDLLISKSTIDEDMRKLRSFLSSYSIEAISVPKTGVTLCGDERKIRTMLFDVINRQSNVYKFMKNRQEYISTASDKAILEYINPDTLSRILKISEKYLIKIDIGINEIYKYQIVLFVAIWVTRISQGKTLNKNEKEGSDFENNLITQFIDCVCEEFDLSPSLNEIKYITFIINSFNSKDMSNSLDWVTAQIFAVELIEGVERNTGIPFSNGEEDLFEGMYKHISGLLNRIKNDVYIYNPLEENIKANYSVIYEAIKKCIKHIEKKLNKKINDAEIAFLTIYFSAAESKLKKEEECYSYRAVVICNHGVSTGRLLAANLSEIYNIDVLAVLSTKEAPVINKLDNELIFSTVNINIPGKTILNVNPILRQSDKNKIEAFLAENKEKRRKIGWNNESTDLFQGIIRIIE